VNAADTPIPPAELDRWDATIATAEECDKAAGKTDDAIVNARSAFGRFATANGRRS
jgi:hypothetical protein